MVLPPASRQTARAAYPRLGFLIGGQWRYDAPHESQPVIDPATGETLAALPLADVPTLDAAAEAAREGAALWRATAPDERGRLMLAAAELLRQRADIIGAIMTLEQGRPLAEACAEVRRAADFISWNAEAGPRMLARNRALKPIGPVLALTPWNVPMLSPARKVSMALAAGCSCVLKPSEATPGTALELARAFVDAGLPAGVLNVVFGDPATVSEHLIRHPAIRKISLTGSTLVGKRLAMLAGAEMKPVTMELGGHAPVVVFADCDIDAVARMAAQAKFRNGGQICTSPTRFFIEQPVYERFVAAFVATAKAISVGDGFAAGTMMGPLANARRVAAMERIVADALAHGARVLTGGARIGTQGSFFAPTVLANVADNSLFLHEEPFGPLASVAPFTTLDDAIARANALPVGLAGYVFSTAEAMLAAACEALDVGIVGLNRFAVSEADVPFGGVRDSGYGREGGEAGIAEFLIEKPLLR